MKQIQHTIRTNNINEFIELINKDKTDTSLLKSIDFIFKNKYFDFFKEIFNKDDFIFSDNAYFYSLRFSAFIEDPEIFKLILYSNSMTSLDIFDVCKHLVSFELEDKIKLIFDYHKKITPEIDKNHLIVKAYNNDCHSIIDFLWQYDSVKKTLPYDNPKVFNAINIKYISAKINNF